MDQNDPIYIGKKSARGAVALTIRTFLVQGIALAATFLLAVLLTPEVFGVFYIVSSIVNLLNYFSDIGLAAALIQKKESLTGHDLETTFTIQQLLVATAVIVILVLSPTIGNIYHLRTDGIVLIQVLAVSFFLSSLKTIPSILLERDLEFNRLIIPQLVETVLFNVSLVVLAYLGYGLTSYTVAVLLRSVGGTLTMYFIKPWRPRFAFDREVAKRLTTYGLPIQANSILAFIKDDLFAIWLGTVIPTVQMGYIAWAKKWAEMPLRLIMDNVIKVTFPMYSRLQHDQQGLSRAVEKVVFILSLFIFPITLEMIFLINPLIGFIPRLSIWEPAVFSFYIFCFSVVFSTISAPLTNLLNSVGKVKTTFIFMVFWTITTWVLIPLLLLYFGFNAVAIGILCISLSSLLIVHVVQKHIPFSFIKPLMKSLLISVPLALFLLASQTLILMPMYKIVFLMFGGLVVWGMTAYILAKNELYSLLHLVLHEK